MRRPEALVVALVAALTTTLATLALLVPPAWSDDTPSPTTPTTSPASSPTTSPATVPTRFSVTDAQLRWGMSNEANNAAHAPGTFNLLSAGQLRNPGRGGTTMSASDWSATDGAVRIEKYDATSSSYRLATWAGTSTDTSGSTITSASAGRYSGHQVVINGGTGTVDTAARSARISWQGTWTVAFYSGMTFFYLSDPVLTVDNGIGTLTATASGYGSSLTDTSRWVTLPARTVTLADLGPVDVSAALGFTATPAYAGVTFDAADGTTRQVRTGTGWGAFPTSFLRFLEDAGSSAFWYSSGGSTDSAKAALPVTVSYSAGAPLAATPTPTASASKKAAVITTSAPTPPPTTRTTSRTPAVPAPATTAGAAPVVTAAPGATAVTSALSTGIGTSAITVRHVSQVLPQPEDSAAAWWWTAAALLLLAAVVVAGSTLLIPSPTPHRATRRTN